MSSNASACGTSPYYSSLRLLFQHFLLFPLPSCCPLSPLCLSLPVSPFLTSCLLPACRSCPPSLLHLAVLPASSLLPPEPFHLLLILLSSNYSLSLSSLRPLSALLSSPFLYFSSCSSTPTCVSSSSLSSHFLCLPVHVLSFFSHLYISSSPVSSCLCSPFSSHLSFLLPLFYLCLLSSYASSLSFPYILPSSFSPTSFFFFPSRKSSFSPFASHLPSSLSPPPWCPFLLQTGSLSPRGLHLEVVCVSFQLTYLNSRFGIITETLS